MSNTIKFSTIDEYHAIFPNEIKEQLQTLRNIIKITAPQAIEVISYNMPAFKLNNKILVYYAAAKKHIGFYPHTTPIVYFKNELENYKTSKGAIQFPLNDKLPKILIEKIVKFRMAEDAEKDLEKKKTPKK